MRLFPILLIAINFAIIHALCDIPASQPRGVVENYSSIPNVEITLYSSNLSDTDQVQATLRALRLDIGGVNAQKTSLKDSGVAWNLSLTSADQIDTIRAQKGVLFDEATNSRLEEFEETSKPPQQRGDDNKPIYYSVIPREYKNDSETTETGEFVKSKAQNSDPKKQLIAFTLPVSGHTIGWLRVALDDKAKAELEADPRIQSPISGAGKIGFNRAVTNTNISHDTTVEPPYASNKQKRASWVYLAYKNLIKRLSLAKRVPGWYKQANAGFDLVMISQPQ